MKEWLKEAGMEEEEEMKRKKGESEESLSSEGSATSGGSSGTTEDTSSEVACDITLIERLIRSHPIWFLPGIQRAGAFHLLQGKEEGVSVLT
ncbi:hypothetical protein M0802_015220 [Mischocyttarus mexicanus]|nr:hypothetical protein M0802_015220 [Mischocyttarus mexicanus]